MASNSLRRMAGRWPSILLWLGLNGLGIAYGTQCDASSPANPTNLNAYIALGPGSCTLPNNGGTISNIRYSATVKGGGTAGRTDGMGIVPFGPAGAAITAGLDLLFHAESAAQRFALSVQQRSPRRRHADGDHVVLSECYIQVLPARGEENLRTTFSGANNAYRTV